MNKIRENIPVLLFILIGGIFLICIASLSKCNTSILGVDVLENNNQLEKVDTPPVCKNKVYCPVPK